MGEIVFDAKIPDEERRGFIVKTILNRFNFIESKTLGESLLGRNIPVLQIGNKEKSILLTGAYHGLEWLTSLVLLKFVEDLCEKIEKESFYSDLLKKRGLTIVPCVNPDGVEIALKGPAAAGKYKSLAEKCEEKGKNKIEEGCFWNSNGRGVDINHNFDAGWEDLHKREIAEGITGPGAKRYGGERPESEPETKAIANLCRKINFECVFAFHSQGEEIYWDFGEKTPKNSLKIAQKMASLSGYTVSKPEGLAVGGGFKDWFIEKFKKPGFTIEIGKGVNPLPLSDLNPIYKKIEGMLYFIVKDLFFDL